MIVKPYSGTPFCSLLRFWGVILCPFYGMFYPDIISVML